MSTFTMLLILIIFLFYTYKVYNETIRDLLMPGQPLAVREDPQRGVCVSGLTLHKVLFISNKHWIMYDIEDIFTWRCGDTKFLFECWKNISQVKRNFVSPSSHIMSYLLYKHK